MTSGGTKIHDAITLIQLLQGLTFRCKFRKLKVFVGLRLNHTNNDYCHNKKEKAVWLGHSNDKSLA